jgi:S-adenosylmethionine-diacylglycerol 3-amino-3-carboxypropyl transferase
MAGGTTSTTERMCERPGFAIVREDPEIEAEVVANAGARSALVVASGGCTLLTLAHRFPQLDLVGYDANPVQIAHVRRKLMARTDLARLNVGDANPDGLSQCGRFEGLFRVLRGFLVEFVQRPGEVDALLDVATTAAERSRIVARWFSSPLWPVAFDVSFEHGFLDALFTRAATQHAVPGSYPRYFQRVFEDLLGRDDVATNPFVEHVLLGMFRRAPEWANDAPLAPFALVHGGIPDVGDLSRFDVIHVSNIFDWSDGDTIARWRHALTAGARPGAFVIVRQLNNPRDPAVDLGPAFEIDEPWSRSLTQRSRVRFYDRIVVARRRQ